MAENKKKQNNLKVNRSKITMNEFSYLTLYLSQQ